MSLGAWGACTKGKTKIEVVARSIGCHSWVCFKGLFILVISNKYTDRTTLPVGRRYSEGEDWPFALICRD